MKLGLVVVSDHVFLDPSLDKVKTYVEQRLRGSELELGFVAYVPNDIHAIRRAVYRALESSDTVLICGGTGASSLDLSIEALRPLLDKELELGEYVRIRSMENVGSRAYLSRSLAGVVEGKLVVAIPAKLDAVDIALEVIRELAEHVKEVARGVPHWGRKIVVEVLDEVIESVATKNMAKRVVEQNGSRIVAYLDLPLSLDDLRTICEASTQCIALRGRERTFVALIGIDGVMKFVEIVYEKYLSKRSLHHQA